MSLDRLVDAGPFPASVLRPPSATAACTCDHYAFCDHACHHRDCDPTENACSIEFLPDEGGLTPWGCRDCTPGDGAPHFLGCELMMASDGQIGAKNARAWIHAQWDREDAERRARRSGG